MDRDEDSADIIILKAILCKVIATCASQTDTFDF